MSRRQLRRLLAAASPPLLLLGALASCDLPRDPERTLERARGGVLRVGAVASPPYLMPTEEAAAGPEAEAIGAFARSIDAEVDWRWGSLDEHMRSLDAFHLDLVAAGLTTASPWKSKAGFSRPWRAEAGREFVFALAPGENAMLVALEESIETWRTKRP